MDIQERLEAEPDYQVNMPKMRIKIKNSIHKLEEWKHVFIIILK